MSINARKSAVRNQVTMINNQLSTIFTVNSGTVSLTNTTSTSFVSNGNYFIPLVSKLTGDVSLNVNTDLSYNASTNTLLLKNLTIQNPPVCYADASNSYDLVNKAHLNKYVGDYTQGWLCEDWLTSTVAGTLNWSSTVANSGTTSSITSEVGHVGIVRLSTANGINNSSATLTTNTSICYTSPKIKSLRFLVRPIPNGNLGSVTINLGIGNSGNSSTSLASWRYNATTTGASDNKWECIVNGNVSYTLSSLNALSPLNSYFNNQWVLFEIEFDSLGKPSFYITLIGTTNRTLVYRENTLVVDTTILIRPFIYINSITGADKQIDVDYIDWLYSGMNRI